MRKSKQSCSATTLVLIHNSPGIVGDVGVGVVAQQVLQHAHAAPALHEQVQAGVSPSPFLLVHVAAQLLDQDARHVQKAIFDGHVQRRHACVMVELVYLLVFAIKISSKIFLLGKYFCFQMLIFFSDFSTTQSRTNVLFYSIAILIKIIKLIGRVISNNYYTFKFKSKKHLTQKCHLY